MSSDVPREVRWDLMESLEDIGSAIGLLREAIYDVDEGNVRGGKTVGSDALNLLTSLEERFSGMVERLAEWSDG